MKKLVLVSIAVIISLTSCDELLDNVDDEKLTEEEVVDGLKTALKVGTDSSTTHLSALNGYYKDSLVKILLPPEADIIMEYKDHEVLSGLNLDKLVDNVIVTMNRAAEKAANKAQPIFVDAITGMSIADGMDILQGNDTAATHYLRENTYGSLKSAYMPVVDSTLSLDLVGNISPNDAWNTLTDNYNEVANYTDLEPVNADLKEHVTTEALDGLFLKVAKEEGEIRKDPKQWTLDILHKVFGEDNT